MFGTRSTTGDGIPSSVERFRRPSKESPVSVTRNVGLLASFSDNTADMNEAVLHV